MSTQVNPQTDYATSDPSLILEGTCAAQTDSIWVNSSQSGVTYTAGQTAWSYTTTLVEGSSVFDVTAKSTAQDESGPTRITITLDTTPAGAPVITTNDGGDFTTQSSHLVLGGTCDADVDLGKWIPRWSKL